MMTYKALRISVTFFVMVSLVVTIAINLIPRNNFIAAPALTIMLYIPLMIVQLLLLIKIWKREKKVKWRFYFSLAIMLIFLYVFYHFLKTTT